MPITEYQFIPGNGDGNHAQQLSEAGRNGWKAVQMEFNPDFTVADKRVIVLLERQAESKP